MTQEIILGGALANCGSDGSTDALLNFLKEQTEDVDYYKLSPPPGVAMAAALDWQAIVNITSSAITIAQALWFAYKKFVKPLREKGQKNAFLFVTVKNNEHDYIQFSVGTDITDEGEFIRKFSQSVEKIRVSSDGEFEVEKREIEFSDHWKKI